MRNEVLFKTQHKQYSTVVSATAGYFQPASLTARAIMVITITVDFIVGTGEPEMCCIASAVYNDEARPSHKALAPMDVYECVTTVVDSSRSGVYGGASNVTLISKWCPQCLCNTGRRSSK